MPKAEFCDIWSRCMQSTTHHGLGHAANSSRSVLKIFWLMVVLSAYSVFAFHLFTLVRRYNEKPVASSIQHGTLQFTFPDVTVCNLMPFSLRVLELRNMSISNLTREGIRQMSEIASLDADDFLVYCYYNEFECDLTEFLKIDETTYRHCYTFRPSNRVPTSTKPEAGLNLILFGDNQHRHPIQRVKSNTGGLEAAGVRVVVHEPFTHPHPSIHGFDVSTGTYAKIAIEVEQIILWPTTNSTTNRKKCEEERPDVTYCNPDSKYQRSYSAVQEDCETENLQNDIYELCGCISSRYEVPVKFCTDYPANHCATDAEIRCEMKQLKQLHAHYLGSMQTCSPLCERHIWNTRLSLSTWPAHIAEDHVMETVRSHYNQIIKYKNNSALDELATSTPEQIEKYDMLAKNLVRLTVYPESLSGNRIVEDEAYPMTSLLGEIGGILGLYLGCSMLTFFELFPMFLNLLSSLFKCDRKQRTHDVEAEPAESAYKNPQVHQYAPVQQDSNYAVCEVQFVTGL